jgi:hypothetical protein
MMTRRFLSTTIPTCKTALSWRGHQSDTYPHQFLRTIVFISIRSKNMEQQDLHPFDKTILGLNRIFHTIGEDSFFVNSPCIMAEDQIVTRGLHYFLIGSQASINLDLNTVILLDVYYHDELNLIVQDVITGRKYKLTCCVGNQEKVCYWLLVDSEYLLKKANGGKHATR